MVTEMVGVALDRTETIILPAAVLATIRAHAEAAYPEECCGALLGRSGAELLEPTSLPANAHSPIQARGVRNHSTLPRERQVSPVKVFPDNSVPRREVLRAIPVRNEWTGSRAANYLIPAAAVRTLEADARRAGLDIVGFYHSHPDGTAVPSAADRETAWPWYSYLIVAATAGGAGRIRVWRLHDDRSGFAEQLIRPAPILHEEEICS